MTQAVETVQENSVLVDDDAVLRSLGVRVAQAMLKGKLDAVWADARDVFRSLPRRFGVYDAGALAGALPSLTSLIPHR